MKPMTPAAAGRRSATPCGRPARRLVAAVAGDAQPERLQDLRPGHGRPARRHGQRGRPLPRSLQEVAAGDGRRHAGRHLGRVLRALLASPSCDAVAARAGIVRPAGHADPCRARRHALSADRLGRGLGPPRGDSCRSSAAGRELLLLQRPSSNEAGFLLQLFARRSARTTSTTAPTTATRRAASASAPALGTGTATVQLEDVEHSDLFFLIGGNPASNHPRLMRSLMSHPPPRRPRHRHQPGQGSRAGQLPRAQRPPQPAVRDRRSPASTCSRTSAATSRC